MRPKKTTLFALLLAVLLALSAPAAAEGSPFTDVSDGIWYAQAVAYCHQNGWMSGTSDTAFSPSLPMNRAMLATVLYRACLLYTSFAATISKLFQGTRQFKAASSDVLPCPLHGGASLKSPCLFKNTRRNPSLAGFFFTFIPRRCYNENYQSRTKAASPCR